MPERRPPRPGLIAPSQIGYCFGGALVLELGRSTPWRAMLELFDEVFAT